MITAPISVPSLDKGKALYRTMLLIRRFEEACAKAYAGGKIQGFCHLYIGQEAVAASAIDTLEPGDVVYTTYRDHGHALAKGMPPKTLMAELFGRVDGSSHGLGGSMHLFDKERGLWGGYGIVGGHVPLAVGTAYAFRYQETQGVVLCFLGEGATNQGVFFEALQLAQLWSVPVVFVVENNHYAMGTPQEKQTPVADLTTRAQAFGIASERIEDTEVFALRDTIQGAVDRARSDSQPAFIEVLTYRYRGHSMSDPAKYRSKEELSAHKERDPLKVLAASLRDLGASEELLTAMDAEIREQVQQAVEFADASPWPELSLAQNTILAGEEQ